MKKLIVNEIAHTIPNIKPSKITTKSSFYCKEGVIKDE